MAKSRVEISLELLSQLLFGSQASVTGVEVEWDGNHEPTFSLLVEGDAVPDGAYCEFVPTRVTTTGNFIKVE